MNTIAILERATQKKSRLIIALTILMSSFLGYSHASADVSGCYEHTADKPWVIDGPGTGDAFLYGSVYLECNVTRNRTVSAYLMEDLYLASDA